GAEHHRRGGGGGPDQRRGGVRTPDPGRGGQAAGGDRAQPVQARVRAGRPPWRTARPLLPRVRRGDRPGGPGTVRTGGAALPGPRLPRLRAAAPRPVRGPATGPGPRRPAGTGRGAVGAGGHHRRPARLRPAAGDDGRRDPSDPQRPARLRRAGGRRRIRASPGRRPQLRRPGRDASALPADLGHDRGEDGAVMLAGHFGISGMVKAWRPELPMGVLLVASQAPDLLFLPLAAAGVEGLEPVAGHSGYGSLLINAPYSHALLSAALL